MDNLIKRKAGGPNRLSFWKREAGRRPSEQRETLVSLSEGSEVIPPFRFGKILIVSFGCLSLKFSSIF